jgi:nucleoside-diphosphate-sugar epimerase
VLVTGAAGFLGRAVVAALLDRGHQVRVVLRASTRAEELPWHGRVEVFRADLRSHPSLQEAFEGVDAVVHLAAAMSGGESAMFSGTVTSTERLLDAMALTPVRRLVVASSYAVYGWGKIHGRLDESSPVEDDLYSRDAYAVAKVWQERVCRRRSTQYGWDLTVLRPGYVWGPGGEWVYGLGIRAGPVLAVVAPRARLPLTHVRNCADCFAAVVDDERSFGETYNVVDGHPISTWEYAGHYLRWVGGTGRRLPLPYAAGLGMARAVSLAVGAAARRPTRLPSLFVPSGFEARFKPLVHSNTKLAAELGWHPPVTAAACLAQTFG